MLVVALLSIFLIGMRSIALKLSNPFGTNKLDFDIEARRWRHEATLSATALAASARPSSHRMPWG